MRDLPVDFICMGSVACPGNQLGETNYRCHSPSGTKGLGARLVSSVLSGVCWLPHLKHLWVSPDVPQLLGRGASGGRAGSRATELSCKDLTDVIKL